MRVCFDILQMRAKYVAVKLSNKRTRVGYLLKKIDSQDKDVTMALSHICLDNINQAGMRNQFERVVVFLLPMDPHKKKKGGKRTSTNISATNTSSDKVRSGGRGPTKEKVSSKPSYGKTGVELRYYKLHEWKNLSKEQQVEVRDQRTTKVHRLEKGQTIEMENQPPLTLTRQRLQQLLLSTKRRSKKRMRKRTPSSKV